MEKQPVHIRDFELASTPFGRAPELVALHKIVGAFGLSGTRGVGAGEDGGRSERPEVVVIVGEGS